MVEVNEIQEPDEFCESCSGIAVFSLSVGKTSDSRLLRNVRIVLCVDCIFELKNQMTRQMIIAATNKGGK